MIDPELVHVYTRFLYPSPVANGDEEFHTTEPDVTVGAKGEVLMRPLKSKQIGVGGQDICFYFKHFIFSDLKGGLA